MNVCCRLDTPDMLRINDEQITGIGWSLRKAVMFYDRQQFDVVTKAPGHGY